MTSPTREAVQQPPRPAEWLLVGIAVGMSLALAFANLGVPSLWHDEIVHVLVARSIADTGQSVLPSGRLFLNGTVFNVILAGFIKCFGDGEFAMRTPSALFAGANVLLLYLLLRAVLGRGVALVAAFGLALSPWSVAWAREARFYALQQTLYLGTLLITWHAAEAKTLRKGLLLGAAALAVYLLAIFTSFHSVLFLAPIGLYAFLLAVKGKRLKSRWTLLACVVLLVGIVTVVGYLSTLSQMDYDALIKDARLGGQLPDRQLEPARADRFYYFRWLNDNLSTGFLALVVVGSLWLLAKERRQGLFVVLAFWAPLLMLTYFIGYRRQRFMYFAFPFYVAAFSYAAVQLAQFLPTARQSRWRAVAAVAVVLLGARLAWSAVKLVGDSLETARGANITLARRHPQWREPCAYVRARVDGAAVISTSYLPVLYYVGQIDTWYPSRMMAWLVQESGDEGLPDVEALEAFMKEHPKGYFLAEHRRFGHWPKYLGDDIAWVETHMTRVEEASNPDVTVYAWGMSP